MKLPRKRSEKLTLGDCVSLIAIISASSFVLSGATNFIIFARQYRINYFAVATTSDIIVGGFVTFVAIGGMALFMALVLIGGLTVARQFDKKLELPPLTVRSALGVFAFSAVIATVFVWQQSTWGDQWPDAGTGMVVAFDADVRPECRGKDVAWVGSDAAVVACDFHNRIFRDLSKLEMMSWDDELERQRNAAEVEAGKN